MRLTLRHGYLPADLDGCLFVAPLRVDAKNIYNAGGGIDAAAPATQVVDALGTFIHPDTGLITPATANVLRVGAGLDLASRLKGALFEGARTNTCLQSEDFNTTWVATRAPVTINDIAAPDGNLTADKIVEDSTAGATHLVTQAISVISGQKVVISVFAKKGERTEILLQAGGAAAPANANVWFDLNAGTKGTVGAGVVDSGMDDMGGGWYRCWLVFTADATDTFSFDILLGSGSETSSYNGDGSSGLYLWGAQCEENISLPTSYIKTTTAAVTRAKDNLKYDNTGEVNINPTAGSLYLAITPGGSPFGTFFDCRTGDVQNIIVLYEDSPSGEFYFSLTSGGAYQATIVSSISPVRGITYVITITWKLNDFRLYVNGVEEANDTSGSAPTAMGTTISFGSTSANSWPTNAQLAHAHIYDAAHDAARVLTNSNEIRAWLGLI